MISLLRKIFASSEEPQAIRTRICWLMKDHDAHLPYAFSSLFPVGSVLLLTYKPKGAFRAVMVKVIGKLQEDYGPTTCKVQITEPVFRCLENPGYGSIEVKVTLIK